MVFPPLEALTGEAAGVSPEVVVSAVFVEELFVQPFTNQLVPKEAEPLWVQVG
ncbi:MAG: hypothetical protein SAK29_23300 [Scytonema sp. PMC 1069.18]|nr:hypothetical protein [Scytonema sp. PMC 1069.18]